MTELDRQPEDTIITGIEPDIITPEPRDDFDSQTIEPVVPTHIEMDTGVVDVSRDAEIGATAGYIAGMVRDSLLSHDTEPHTRAQYAARSPLVEREERVGKTGKTFERLNLTSDGKRAVNYIETLVRGESAYSRESYAGVKVYLQEVYNEVKTILDDEQDTQLKSAQLGIARTLIAEVRSNAYEAYKRQEKEIRQAPVRELIAVAIGHLGLANLVEESSLQEVYRYLREHQTEENISVVRSARQLVRLDHEKAKAQAEARAQREAERQRLAVLAEEKAAREAAIKEKSRRVERALRIQTAERVMGLGVKLTTAAIAATLAIAGGAHIFQQAEASRLRTLPTAVAVAPEEPQARSQQVVYTEQQTPEQQSVPVTIRESGPISLHVRYKNEQGLQDLKLGYKGKDPSYRFFSINGLTRQQQDAVIAQYRAAGDKMKSNEVFAFEYGPVLVEQGHAAMYLDRQVYGPLVNLSEQMIDSETGKPKSDQPAYIEKRDRKNRQEFGRVVGWVRVPRLIKDIQTGKTRVRTLSETIRFVQGQLPGVKFDGITSTCLIREGTVVGSPEFYLTAVTVRVTPDQLPAEMKPHSPNDQGIEMTYADDDREQGETAARNPLKHKNPLNIWQERQARLQRQLARR